MAEGLPIAARPASRSRSTRDRKGDFAMANATPPSTRPEDLATAPGPLPQPNQPPAAQPHRGVVVTGENREDGSKAFYIHIQARPGREAEVIQMLEDIYGCVLGEPATGPWFGVRYSPTTFGIFEAFPNITGRDAHVVGGGGNIFRDNTRMNDILAYPAHVYRMDVLFSKKMFAE